ncbi:MAG TPA: hypothetical protein VFJ58_03585, partial [Armatimonadota bacterium]|nr:hypothetical protein [Armatimonadota bacterium]
MRKEFRLTNVYPVEGRATVEVEYGEEYFAFICVNDYRGPGGTVEAEDSEQNLALARQSEQTEPNVKLYIQIHPPANAETRNMDLDKLLEALT